MEILRSESEKVEEEARKKLWYKWQLDLIYSELEAMEHIFEELDGPEGLLVEVKLPIE